MAQVVAKLWPCLLGWMAYFWLAQTPKDWQELDECQRHRLRVFGLSSQALEGINDDLPRHQSAGAPQDVAMQLAVTVTFGGVAATALSRAS
jgi:Group II intron, maturase-specific domain